MHFQFGGIIEHSVADGCDFGAIQENFAIMEQHIVPWANFGMLKEDYYGIRFI